MANLVDKLILVAVWIAIDVYVAKGREKVHSDVSEEEFNESNSQRFPRHDQSRDGTTSYGDSVPFVNDNPGNYFMDLYSVQTGPKQVEFGHVYENPDTWEQRYEKKDHENKRFQGQARWGDKNGGYGEQYWDYNHAGPENEEPYEDPNEGSSLIARSPSFDPSPSPYNSVSQSMKPTRAMSSSTTYSEPNDMKSTRAMSSSIAYSEPKRPKKNRKRYEEPPQKRTSPSKVAESSSVEENYFVLPRLNPTTEEIAAHQKDSDSGPLRFHLYEQPNMLPTTYEHVLQITPSTPKPRVRNIKP